MKKSLRFITLSLIVIFVSSAFGQTEARLFTTFGPASNCEEIMAQLDGFAIELQNDPTKVSKIVTYGDPKKPLDAFFREATIKRYLAIRLMDIGRVSLTRGESRSEMKTEIWIIPAGAENPPIAGADWSYDLSGRSEPLKFGVTGSDDIGGCESYDFELLVKFLEANPSMTVKGVFKETSTVKYSAAVKEFGDALAEKGIARNRLTASYVRVAGGKYLESTEIWLVPGKTERLIASVQLPTNAPAPIDGSSGTNVPDIIDGGVINGKAKMLPTPKYPAAARAVRASGAVNVKVLIDEQGNVISAEAVSGHPLLRAAAVNAAKGAKFSPTLLYGKPVKVIAILVFNFVP
jgi:TonB family protein